LVTLQIFQLHIWTRYLWYSYLSKINIFKELLKDHLVGKKRALDIGSGSGYFATLMSKLMNGGFVYAIDHIKEITE
jgi:protein-L-isoaspartate O-methyltransferase